LFIGIIFVFWLLLDILISFVVYESTTPQTDIQYLTTQTWLFGFVAKFALLRQLYMTKCATRQPPVDLLAWLYANRYYICFILYGTMQTAVLFTFFALLAMDSTLLREAMNEYSISVIITWNHLRHVTPVFFYLMTMQAIQPQMKHWCRCKSTQSEPEAAYLHAYKFIFANLVVAFALFMGALHHVSFPDDQLYKYTSGHQDVGKNCILVFSIGVILTTYYSVYAFL
jgi:hypothetical protein